VTPLTSTPRREERGAGIVVLGTGALGCLFGARLAQAGARVTLVGTWPEALAVVATRGIRVDDPGESALARVASARLDQPLTPADFVLVLVKSHQTLGIAAAAAAAVAPRGLIVTLQNGLGNREALESAAGQQRVAVGVVTAGATLLAPGHVRAQPGNVALGSTAATRRRLSRFATLLRRAGFETQLSDDIERLVWRKLAVNCAINPLSVVRAAANGALLPRAEDRELLAQAAREVAAVARARGVDLHVDAARLAWDVAARTADNRSSMLQDVDRDAPTEIDALNGAVVREGRRLGVPTPVNEWLCAEVLRHTRVPQAQPLEPIPL